MGLDVYLYRYENFEADKKREEEYERRTERLFGAEIEAELRSCPVDEQELTLAGRRDKAAREQWSPKGDSEDSPYNRLSEDRRSNAWKRYKKRCDDIQAELGLSEYGSAGTKVEMKSQKYPEHLFEIGYFRSSYNPGGIQHVLRERGLPDMGELFAVGDAYKVRVDWSAARVRLVNALKAWDRHSKNHGEYRTYCFSYNLFTGPAKGVANESDALNIFLEERRLRAEGGSGFDSYSNSKGEFWLKEPLKVSALIPGVDCFKKPCFYAVCEQDLSFYRQALEIMLETCEWVLAKGDPTKYILHWSS